MREVLAIVFLAIVVASGVGVLVRRYVSGLRVIRCIEEHRSRRNGRR